MAVTETIICRSDLISVREAHPNTKLILYSNNTDFAGIIYSGLDPVPNFAIRIEAKFFKERFPEENESENLSDGSVVKLLGTVKDQKQLQVEPAPYYLHKKLKRILQHNTIFIDNLAWEKEENYETEDIDEMNPFATGNGYLTEKTGTFVTNPFS